MPNKTDEGAPLEISCPFLYRLAWPPSPNNLFIPILVPILRERERDTHERPRSCQLCWSTAMTMNPHSSAAIAQLVFYIPMLPIAIYLMIANWGFGPRMAWYPPTPYAMSKHYPRHYRGLLESKVGLGSLMFASNELSTDCERCHDHY